MSTFSPRTVDDLLTEVWRRDPMLPAWIDVDFQGYQTIDEIRWAIIMRSGRRGLPWLYHYVTLGERELDSLWSDHYALAELIDSRYRELRAQVLLHLFVQFPLWWEGESVLDGAS